DKYLEIIRIRFLMMLAYRTNYYTGIIIYIINIGAYYFLWKAIYGARGELEGVSMVQMTTYVAIAWMARAFYFNNIDREIANDVRDGKVATELIRPYNYLLTKLMQALGEGLFRIFLFSLPGMIIVAFIFPVNIPIEPELWFYFLVSITFSFIINTQINILTGLSSFFLMNNGGLIRAKRVLIDVFSGLVIPINLFPLWAQDIFKFLPFQSISYTPSMIFSKAFSYGELINALVMQGVWSLILILPIQIIWVYAKRKVIVQGG
ncbi:MAG: daunorubicin transporter permease, partial [Bacillales bacterium]|nr:daunorubicin transporter permease [Bacillales bacterium]